MATRRLQFRRHLASCVLLLLLAEADDHLRPRAPSGPDGQQQLHQDTGQRYQRIRLASAAELVGPHELDVAASVAQANNHSPDTNQDENDNSTTAKWAHIYVQKQADQSAFDSIRRLAEGAGRWLPVIDLNYSLAGASSAARFGTNRLDEEVDLYYGEQFAANTTLDQLVYMSVVAAKRMAPIPLHTSWGYATERLRSLGSWPVGDPQLCHLQLAHLAERLAEAEAQEVGVGGRPGAAAIHETRDIHLMRLLDTFGRVPSDLLRGNTKWLGSYSSCLDTRLAPRDSTEPRGRGDRLTSRQPAIKFRYCMASMSSPSWPQSSLLQQQHQQRAASAASESDSSGGKSGPTTSDDYFIRIGLCLPEACDSNAMADSRGGAAIERLAKFQLASPFNGDHYRLQDLYCLPDDRSPLRSIPLAGKLLLLLCLAWLALIGLATMIQLNVDKFYTKLVGQIRQQQLTSGASTSGSSNGDLNEPRELDVLSGKSIAASRDNGLGDYRGGRQWAESDPLGLKWNWIKWNVWLGDRMRNLIAGVDLIECLSLYSNWLRYTRRVKLAIVELHRREQEAEAEALAKRQLSGADQTHLSSGQTQDKVARLGPIGLLASGAGGAGGERRAVDTSSLNALKVVALVWIIAGHCIFYLGSVITNGALLSNYLDRLVTFALTNGAIYITELFFIITGCLTTYLLFKHNTTTSTITATKPAEQQPDCPAGTALQMQQLRHGPTSKQPSEQPTYSSSGSQPQLQLDDRLLGGPVWLLMVLHRYLRILPTYLLVYALVKLVSVHAGGEGPTWDYGVSPDSRRRACSLEPWWPTLTLTTNYLDIYEHCIVGGWYLSVDMQFMLMAVPLLFYLARRQRIAFSTNQWAQAGATRSEPKFQSGRPRLGKLGSSTTTNNDDNTELRAPAGGVEITQQRGQQQTTLTTTTTTTTLTGSFAPAYALIVGLALVSALLSVYFGLTRSRADISYLVKFSPHSMAMMAQNISLYTNSLFRFRAYLIGLLVGHWLYLYEFGLLPLAGCVQRHGAKLASGLFLAGFCLMFAPVLYPRGKIVLSHDTTVLLMVACALGVDAFLASMIFLLAIGKAPKLVLFLVNSPFWSLFSSLSLSAFLCHTELIILLVSQLDPPPSVSYGLLLFVFSATLLLTYALALALYLAFELPISRLIESIMRKHFASSSTSTSSSSAKSNSESKSSASREDGQATQAGRQLS